MHPPGGVQLLGLLISLLSVPTVQLVSAFIKPKQTWHRKRISVWRPPRPFGGIRCAVFTAMSWLTWMISVGFAAPVVSPSTPITIPSTHVGVLYGAALACSIVGCVFSIKAIIVFEHTQEQKKRLRIRQVLSTKTGFLVVFLLGMVLALMSSMILVAAEHLPDTSSQLFYCMLSICCALIAASSTYGLGGHLFYGHGASKPTSWRFFQPFTGGQMFVASQGLGWTLFSIFMACVLQIMQQLWHGIVVALKLWALRTGGIILATQLVLGFSVLSFQTGASVEQSVIHPINGWVLRNVPVVALYMITHMFIGVVVASFTLLPTTPVLTFWVIGLTAYYIATSIGSPTQSGCRKIPAVRKWFAKHLTKSLKLWQGDVELIYVGRDKPDPNENYIIGFHPHGLYPLGAAALPLLDGFDDLFPGFTPATLAASMMFLPPFQRDLLHWWGVRDVSRKTFVRALKDERAVIVCPGGQEELVETYKLFQDPSALVLCTRHKGFCRLAIENQACLVPVLALGEAFTVQNAFDAPRLQMATYRILGFPIPYLLVGRWGICPLPKKVALRYIMGEPIKPPSVEPGVPVPRDKIDSLHDKYYCQLLELFHQFKDRHDYYSKTKIKLKVG